MSNKDSYNKTMGVIGGMGPEATKAFYERIIVALQSRWGYWEDEHYPEIHIISLPLPNVWHGKPVNEDEVVSMLCTAAERLEENGCDFLAMPCNSAHLYFKHIRDSVSIPVLNIIEETCKEIKSKKFKSVGLLASKTTIEEGLYDKCFNQRDINAIPPSQDVQEQVKEIIDSILAGKKSTGDKEKVLGMIMDLKKQGAEAVVLGCTDLPLLVRPEDTKEVIFDTLQILVEAAIRYIHPKHVDK